MVQPGYRAKRKPAKRGYWGQKNVRDWERDVKKTAVAFAHWVERHGIRPQRAAALLSLKTPTLCAWRRNWRNDRLRWKPRGLP